MKTLSRLNRFAAVLCLGLAGACTPSADGPLWLACGDTAPQGTPACTYRILDHWDNLDDSVERGYAGRSIWGWTEDSIPETRIRTYGRLNQSIGINGAVLNNVNASPRILDEAHLDRVEAIADLLRDYGIRTYLAINFASPKALGGLPTADPLDTAVVAWWRGKVEEIYRRIPDFGGLLVKACSEGQPGPQDFGRTHADGANMLAGLLAPHGGIVMWRAFVYAPDSPDRASQACEEFVPLDSLFLNNVIIQIKNGPVDFQPREPVNPLFFSLHATAMMPELQITQEYLGQSTQLCFLAPMWKECLDTLSRYGAPPMQAVAGVANTGQDDSWCGHVFAAANWYAFGRLAWDPSLTSEQIADEWLRGTFPKPWWCPEKMFRRQFVEPVRAMMLESRETLVDYMMPLGLHHIFAGEHHYGPEPWYAPRGMRADWTPPYYHKADTAGIGFDRTTAGSGNVAWYPEPLRAIYNNPETCPENLLLWFHHLPWDYTLSGGTTLWDALCRHYDAGVKQAAAFCATWQGVRTFVAQDTWLAVAGKLAAQYRDARQWRDACVQYFQTFSRRPLPDGVEAPEVPLDSIRRQIQLTRRR